MEQPEEIEGMPGKKDYKIYLLDDDMFYIHIFQQHLFNLGYTDVSIFSDPVVCFADQHPPPDIIFYDHGQKFLDGLEVLKRVKRLNPDIYMIFTCGPEDVEKVIPALKHGAFDYFVKGCNDVAHIDSILTKIHRIRELLHKNKIARYRKFNLTDNPNNN